MNHVIVNSSSLIILINAEKENLIKTLFPKITVPYSVYKEISKKRDRAGILIRTLDWIEVLEVDTIPEEILLWNLGKGETEVLALAKKLNTSAILDDGSARKCASYLDISFIGTAGILIKSKKEGLISSVKENLICLKDSGLWISDNTMNLILKIVEEL